jgi:protein-arginine kinase
MSRNKAFLVWINEEDHLRAISIQKGASLPKAYARLIKGVQILDAHFKFVFHPRFGYITFSPTNIGTSLNISVQCKLPKLAASGKLEDLCESLNLEARVVKQEPNEKAATLYEIMNLTKMNKTEFEIVNLMFISIKKLLDEEFSTK